MSNIKNDASTKFINDAKEYIAYGDSCASLEKKDYKGALEFYTKAEYSLFSVLSKKSRNERDELLGIVCYKIADLHFYGRIDGRINYESAVEWYKYAISYGNVRAKLNLAYIYLGVFNVPEYYDRDAGIHYLSELADAGNEEAQLFLGSILLSDGFSQNLAGAEKCFKKCGSQYGMYRVQLKKDERAS